MSHEIHSWTQLCKSPCDLIETSSPLRACFLICKNEATKYFQEPPSSKVLCLANSNLFMQTFCHLITSICSEPAACQTMARTWGYRLKQQDLDLTHQELVVHWDFIALLSTEKTPLRALWWPRRLWGEGSGQESCLSIPSRKRECTFSIPGASSLLSSCTETLCLGLLRQWK